MSDDHHTINPPDIPMSEVDQLKLRIAQLEVENNSLKQTLDHSERNYHLLRGQIQAYEFVIKALFNA